MTPGGVAWVDQWMWHFSPEFAAKVRSDWLDEPFAAGLTQVSRNWEGAPGTWGTRIAREYGQCGPWFWNSTGWIWALRSTPRQSWQARGAASQPGGIPVPETCWRLILTFRSSRSKIGTLTAIWDSLFRFARKTNSSLEQEIFGAMLHLFRYVGALMLRLYLVIGCTAFTALRQVSRTNDVTCKNNSC